MSLAELTHVLEARRLDAVHEHIVGCVQVEALLDFGVRGEEDVGPSRDQDELVEGKIHNRTPEDAQHRLVSDHHHHGVVNLAIAAGVLAGIGVC